MKHSIKRLNEFVNASKIVLNTYHQEEKLKGAITKVLRRVAPCFEKYHDILDDIQLDFVNTDANGSILRDPDGKYAFTPAKAKELKPKVQELINQDDYEVVPVFIRNLPDDFPEELKEHLKGFVIE